MHNLLEIFKTLMEEPHKVARAVFAFLRCLLALFLAIALYQACFGTTALTEIGTWTAWGDGTLATKLLTLIFLFIVAYWGFFNIMPLLTVAPFELWADRPFPKMDDEGKKKNAVKFVLNALTWFNVIEYDAKADHLKAGRRLDGVVDFLEMLDSSSEEDSEMDFSSYLQAWQLFSVFTVYYFISPLKPFHVWLSCLIILTLIVIPLFYVFATKLLNFLTDRREPLLFAAQGLLFDRKLEDAFRLQGYRLTEHRSEDGLLYWRTIFIQGQEYHYWFCWTRDELTPKMIDIMLKSKMPPAQPLLLVTNTAPGPRMAEQVEAFQERLTVLVIPTDDDIESAIRVIFRREKQTMYLI